MAFTCPEGFVFGKSNNVTHYVWCYDWTLLHQFDVTAMCRGKWKCHELSRFIHFCTESSHAAEINCGAPPPFAPDTWEGAKVTTALLAEQNEEDVALPLDEHGNTMFIYQSKAIYQCPPGFVPEEISRENDSVAAFSSERLLLTCGRSALWEPHLEEIKCVRKYKIIFANL